MPAPVAHKNVDVLDPGGKFYRDGFQDGGPADGGDKIDAVLKRVGDDHSALGIQLNDAVSDAVPHEGNAFRDGFEFVHGSTSFT